MITLNEVNLIISMIFKISINEINGDLDPENISESPSCAHNSLIIIS